MCSLNPIYGQGMTVAALQALELRAHLGQQTAPDPHRWLRRVAQIVDPAWDMVVGGDLALPGVHGPRTPKVRALGAYIGRLHAAAATDPELAVAFARVMALVDPPTTLLRPRVAARVLLGGRRAISLDPSRASRARGDQPSAAGGRATPRRNEEVRR